MGVAHSRSRLSLMIHGRTLAELRATYIQSSPSDWAAENARLGVLSKVSSFLCLKTLCPFWCLLISDMIGLEHGPDGPER